MSTEPKPTTGEGAGAETVRGIVAASRDADYDGHTEFSRMSPRDRLTWLDAAITFVASQRNRIDAAVREEPRPQG